MKNSPFLPSSWLHRADMFTVRRGVNFHFFRFEELTPKIAWRVACDVGVGCLFWKGKKISGTFKEEEKSGRNIVENRSWSLSRAAARRARACSLGRARRGRGAGAEVKWVLLHIISPLNVELQSRYNTLCSLSTYNTCRYIIGMVCTCM